MAAMNCGVFQKNGGAIPKKKREKRVDSNQFAALATNEHIEIDVDHHVQDTVDDLIKNLRNGDGKSDIGRIIAQVIAISALQPVITEAVTIVAKSICGEHEKRLKTENDKLKRQIQMLSLKNDDLEQYSRKENVRIHGFPETDDNEDKVTLVVNLVQKVGVQIDEKHISVAHRLPGNRYAKKPRTIIVKFVRRTTKNNLMRKKANLRNTDGPNIFMTDDLTRLRGKMLYEMKQDADVERAYSFIRLQTDTREEDA